MYFLSFIRRHYFVILIFLLLITVIFFVTNLNNSSNDFNDDRVKNIILAAENQSLCSERSARRGLNQCVLSVSAYESTDRITLKTNATWSFIEIFTKEAKKFYPSWVVRVYYYDLHKTKQDFKDLENKYDNLDFCNVEHLPVLGNFKNKIPGKMQRFLSAIDPMVGVAMTRDLDSEIYQREIDAVNEWLTKTTYAFHIMRDHEQHGIEILGGLWGVASNRLSAQNRLKIARALIPSENEKEHEKFLKTYSKAGDQLFLRHYLWPMARKNSLVHDSFTCLWSYYIYGCDTRPFPSKREHPACFVGCPKPCCTTEMKREKDLSKYKQCPSSCRPRAHPDWIFC